MKRGEYRQGEGHPFTLPENMRHDGADQEKHEKAREARRERQRSGTPGGPAQTGGADEARAAMIDRHKGPGEGPEYVTPGEALDTFTQEPYGLEGAAQARARMIERQEKRDGDKSRSLARRSPHQDSKEDPLISAALRDVRDAIGSKHQQSTSGQGAAENARATMIRRKTGQQ